MIVGIVIGVIIGTVIGFSIAALLSGTKCDDCKYNGRK